MKEEMDFIKSSILAIEDFENVDPSLMTEINKNEEYRALFEECRSLSGIIKAAVPAPEKDGVTLHSAIMDRVNCGDIQPRYIRSSAYKFPFASVACLLAVAVVIFISKTNTFKYANDEALDYEAPNENTLLLADSYSTDAGDNAVYEECEQEAGENAATNARFNETQIIAKNDSDSSVSPRVFQSAPSFDRYTPEEYEYYVKDEQTSYAQVAETESVIFDAADKEAEKEKQELSEKTLSILEKAALLTDSNRISEQDILLLGEDAFCEFFESICESDDFSNLYTLENFKKFCETRKQ